MLNKLFGRRYAKFDPAIDQLLVTMKKPSTKSPQIFVTISANQTRLAKSTITPEMPMPKATVR